MKIIPFSELHEYDYTVDILRYKYHWVSNEAYDFTEHGRKTNSFFFFADLESIHTFPNKIYNFKKNDFVYFPIESKSKSVYTQHNNSTNEMNGINIKFRLYDKHGEEFKLSDDVIVLSQLTVKNYRNQIFEIANALFKKEPPMYIKANFYKFLTDISLDLNTMDKPFEYKQIANGIKFIEENFSKKITVKEIADTCFISEGYFRRLFSACMGISPIKYLNNIRFEKANELLRSGSFSIAEIADMVGFDTPSYFTLFYKKYTSQLPSHLSPRSKSKNKGVKE